MRAPTAAPRDLPSLRAAGGAACGAGTARTARCRSVPVPQFRARRLPPLSRLRSSGRSGPRISRRVQKRWAPNDQEIPVCLISTRIQQRLSTEKLCNLQVWEPTISDLQFIFSVQPQKLQRNLSETNKSYNLITTRLQELGSKFAGT